MEDAILRLAVVIGSTREGRFGDTLGRWVAQQATTHGGFEVDWVDLAAFDLGAAQSMNHPKMGRYSEEVGEFAARIGAADAFVFVFPEYNHGYPAALKHALDSIYLEWNAKPAALATYGGASGGIRAAEQLRQVLAELHVVTTRDGLALPMAQRRFDAAGALKSDMGEEAAAKKMLDQLAWWGTALAEARASRPYAA